MAFALVGYFTTMVAALTGLMFLLNMGLGLAPTERPYPEPHLRPVIAQSEEPATRPQQGGVAVVHRPADIADLRTTAREPAPKGVRADAQKVRRLKPVRDQDRKVLAWQRKQQDRTAALGYDQEPAYIFNPFGPRRF